MRKFAYTLLGAGAALMLLAFSLSSYGQTVTRVFMGGTGSTTLSGILKGNGTSGVQTAVSGVDYIDSGFYSTTTHPTISSLPALTITEGQISDFQSYLLQSTYFGSTTPEHITGLPNLFITEAQISDLTHYTTQNFATDLFGTTTTALSEGTNLYWTNDRFDARLNATTSLPNITTLAGLSITESQVSDLDHWNISDFNSALLGTTSVDSITELLNLSITESQVSDLDHWDINDFNTSLLGTTSVSSITELLNLLITESQISDLDHYTNSDVDAHLSGGTGIAYSGGAISFDCSEVEGTGINCSGEAITLDATGDWTGTLDGLDSTQFLRSDTDDTMTGSLTITGNATTAGNATTSGTHNIGSHITVSGAGATSTFGGNVETAGYSDFSTSSVSMLNKTIVVGSTNYPFTNDGLQNAIDDCDALKCNAVAVESGVMSVTSNIDFPTGASGIDVYSLGSTTLIATGSGFPSGARGVFNIDGNEDITIRGFNFVINSDGNGVAIQTHGHTSLKILDNDFTGNNTAFGGIVSFNPGEDSNEFVDTLIENNVFHDMLNSNRVIHLYARYNNRIYDTKIHNNRFVNTRAAAIYLDDYMPIVDTDVAGNHFDELILGSDVFTPNTALLGGLSTSTPVIEFLTFRNNYYKHSSTTATSQGGIFIYNYKNLKIYNNDFWGAWSSTTNPTIGEPAVALGRIATPGYNAEIYNNYVNGWDQFIDPDSMVNAEIHHNIIENNGASLNSGYGLQKNVHWHHNRYINTFGSRENNRVIFLAAVSNSGHSGTNISVTDNTFIYDYATTLPIIPIYLSSAKDYSDFRIERNKIFTPNATVSNFIDYGSSSAIEPLVIQDNEVRDSTGIYFNFYDQRFNDDGIIFLGSTTTAAGTTTDRLKMTSPYFVWDNLNTRLGVGSSTPWKTFSVTGDSYVDGNSTTTGHFEVGISTETAARSAGDLIVADDIFINDDNFIGDPAQSNVRIVFDHSEQSIGYGTAGLSNTSHYFVGGSNFDGVVIRKNGTGTGKPLRVQYVSSADLFTVDRDGVASTSSHFVASNAAASSTFAGGASFGGDVSIAGTTFDWVIDEYLDGIYMTTSDIRTFVEENGHLPFFPKQESDKASYFINQTIGQLIEAVERNFIIDFKQQEEIDELKREIERLKSLVIESDRCVA